MTPAPTNTTKGDAKDEAAKAAKPPSKRSAAAVEEENIRKEEKRIIEHILPQAKNDPELHSRVIATIKTTNIARTQRWREARIFKDFAGWLAMAKEGDRPELGNFLALLAVHDSSSSNAASKFRKEVIQRGLREWAVKELEDRRGSAEEVLSEASHASRKAARVKQEETILPSIETCETAPSPTADHASGTKRQAQSLQTERPRKRILTISGFEALIAKVDQLEEAQAAQKRTTSRDFGTQTRTPPTENANRPLYRLADQQGVPANIDRALAEQSRALLEQSRVLLDLPAAIREIIHQETRDAVQQEIQRAIGAQVMWQSENSLRQRSQVRPEPYSVFSGQPAPSFPFDTAGAIQLADGSQGRVPNGRAFRGQQPSGGFDLNPRHSTEFR